MEASYHQDSKASGKFTTAFDDIFACPLGRWLPLCSVIWPLASQVLHIPRQLFAGSTYVIERDEHDNFCWSSHFWIGQKRLVCVALLLSVWMFGVAYKVSSCVSYKEPNYLFFSLLHHDELAIHLLKPQHRSAVALLSLISSSFRRTTIASYDAGFRGISQSRILDLSACRHGNKSQVRAHVPPKRQLAIARDKSSVI